jgi:hypothetical protein
LFWRWTRLAETTLSISGAMQPIINATSDATGSFTAKVCEGAVIVSAYRLGMTGAAQTIGGDTNVVIQLRTLHRVGF